MKTKIIHWLTELNEIEYTYRVKYRPFIRSLEGAVRGSVRVVFLDLGSGGLVVGVLPVSQMETISFIKCD